MIDAVLPIVASDLARVKLLRDSLDTHGTDISRCIVPVRTSEFDEISDAFRGAVKFEVIDETTLFGRKPPRFVRAGLRKPKRAGWYVQQVLKLAAAAGAEKNAVLCLDADVIALRELRYDEMVPHGRAVVQINPDDTHPEWYAGSEAVLNMKRSGRAHNVTPALLDRRGVGLLLGHLEARAGRRDWITHLMRNVPWSEYSLYYSFLESTNRFDEFHVATNEPIMYDSSSVWFSERFDAWWPHVSDASPLFTLVQSTSGIEPKEIRSRLAACGHQFA